jgi:hypothetical protein
LFFSTKTELINLLKNFTENMGDIFFPSFCFTCLQHLLITEKHICRFCLEQMIDEVTFHEPFHILIAKDSNALELWQVYNDEKKRQGFIEALVLAYLLKYPLFEDTFIVFADDSIQEFKILLKIYESFSMKEAPSWNEASILLIGQSPQIFHDTLFLKLHHAKKLRVLTLFS